MVISSMGVSAESHRSAGSAYLKDWSVSKQRPRPMKISSGCGERVALQVESKIFLG